MLGLSLLCLHFYRKEYSFDDVLGEENKGCEWIRPAVIFNWSQKKMKYRNDVCQSVSTLVERTGSLLRFAALCTGVIFSGLVFAKSQTVSFITDTTHFYPSEAFEVSVAYEASDKSLTTGMGIRVHFDSSQISIDSIANSLRQGKVGIQTQQDSTDHDNDPSTDHYINAGWADVNGAWPELLAQPANLLYLNVTTAADFSGTQLNITVTSNDVNYDALGATLRLTSTTGD